MKHKALEKLFALDEAVNHTKKSDKLFLSGTTYSLSQKKR